GAAPRQPAGLHRQPARDAAAGEHPRSRDDATHFTAGAAGGGHAHSDTGDQVVVTPSSSGAAMTIIETRSSTIDSARWPAIARVRSSPVAMASAAVVDRLLRRAAARLPMRLIYPDGTVIGAADATMPTLVLHEPDALARRVGRYGLIGFGESYMA